MPKIRSTTGHVHENSYLRKYIRSMRWMTNTPLYVLVPVAVMIGALARDTVLIKEIPSLEIVFTLLYSLIIIFSVLVALFNILLLSKHREQLCATSLSAALLSSVAGMLVMAIAPDMLLNKVWVLWMISVTVSLSIFSVSCRMVTVVLNKR